MNLKKWQKQIALDMELRKATLPAPRFRSEREMEEIIHRSRVVARKRQIELMKDDAQWQYEPMNLLTYTIPERRNHLLKVVFATFKNGLKQLMP